MFISKNSLYINVIKMYLNNLNLVNHPETEFSGYTPEPTDIKNLHRKAGKGYNALNLDNVEYRKDRGIVAYVDNCRITTKDDILVRLEQKIFTNGIYWLHADVMSNINQKLLTGKIVPQHKVYAYNIFYTHRGEYWHFWIFEVISPLGKTEFVKELDGEDTYLNFIKGM